MSGELRALTGAEWRRLRLARMNAVEQMPYFASAVFAMVPVAYPGLATFAVDRYWRLYVDPALLEEGGAWSIPEAGAVLLHEVGHLLREHGVRVDGLDAPVSRLLWNLAGDAEINDDLLAAGLGLPEGCVTPQSLGCEAGHAAEVYYRELVGSVPPEQRGDPAQSGAAGTGDGAGAGCGSGAGDAPLAGELPEAADLGSGAGLSSAAGELVRVTVARAVQEAAMRGGTDRGTVPAGIARWATAALTPPVIPWQRVLRATVRRSVADMAGQVKHSFTRPNRRAPRGLLLPSMRAPKLTVDLIVDTSGSMGDGDVAAALSEAAAVLRQASVNLVRVTCCDAGATAPRPVRSIRDVQVIGGGGTDMRVGIDAALAARPAADVIVVLTDGGTPWPVHRLPVPLIVALIGKHAVDSAPDWAKTVRVTPAPTAAGGRWAA